MKRLFILFATLGLFISNIQAQENPLSDTIDVLHYDIHLDIIDVSSQQISGYTDVSFTTPLPVFDKLILELMDLEVTEVTVEGIIMPFVYENNRIVVELDDEISQGETLNARINYNGNPFHEGWGGFHFSGEYCFNLGVGFESDPHNLGKSWFPCIDDFKDRAFYDFHITTNENKKAVCGGQLIETINNGNGTNTYHWKMDSDIPTYLASIAIGDYEVVDDTYAGLNGDIPIQYWVKPSQVGNVAGSFVNMHNIMDIFESSWGPYPYSRVGYVSTALGAMEHATNIAYPSGSINGNTDSEWLYAHELAHMWFGDMVTCASAEDMWLNEGWARFNETLVIEGLYGVEAARENMNNLHQDVLMKAHTNSGDGSYMALYGIPTEYTYGMTVYDKGGVVTHTLRHYFGDEVFFPAMKAYLQEFAYNEASSWDLRDFLTNETGIDMTDFFESWVFNPGFPAFEIDSFAYDNGVCDVYLGQKLRGTDEIYNSNRVDVSFMDQDWNITTERIEFSGETGMASFNIETEPVLVMADYYDHIGDATSDKDIVLKESQEYTFSRTHFKAIVEDITDSAFMRVSHNWVAPDAIQNPAPGLRISDSRYWNIDGILPENFSAKGSFFFSTISNLDNTLIQNSGDEVTLLYREGPDHDWTVIPFTMYGPGTFGNLIIDNLQLGEYAIGVWDEEYVDVKKNSKKTGMIIYPNPSNNQFNIEVKNDDAFQLEIYDGQGSSVAKFNISNGSIINWIPKGQITGNYYATIKDEKNAVIGVSKLVYTN